MQNNSVSKFGDFNHPSKQHFGKTKVGTMFRAKRLEGVVKNRGIKAVRKQSKGK